MVKVRVDIDGVQLDRVRGILGTRTPSDTVSAAFAEVIRRAAVQGDGPETPTAAEGVRRRSSWWGQPKRPVM
jgi:hypothetical protein